MEIWRDGTLVVSVPDAEKVGRVLVRDTDKRRHIGGGLYYLDDTLHGRWVHVSDGSITPGGDPVWVCSKCGKGRHVYGVEYSSYGADVSDGQWVACPNCGARMQEV